MGRVRNQKVERHLSYLIKLALQRILAGDGHIAASASKCGHYACEYWKVAATKQAAKFSGVAKAPPVNFGSREEIGVVIDALLDNERWTL